jgi:DNA repair protein RadC
MAPLILTLGFHVILAVASNGRVEGSQIARDGSLTYHVGIKDLPLGVRPRERLRALGAKALSDEELLAIILRTGTRSSSVLELARSILVQYRSLRAVSGASVPELSQIRGVGPVKACDLLAAFELGKRVVSRFPEDLPQITGPEDAYALLKAEMSLLDQESVRVILLNTKNRVQGMAQVSMGSLNSSVVRIGEVFKEAVRQQAAGIVLAHNHPSGDPTPSAEDVALTRKVVDAGQLLDVEVLDHIIIGREGPSTAGWVSLRERGLGFH